MNSAIGFTLIWNNPQNNAVQDKAHSALNKVLGQFPELQYHQIQVGNTKLTLWGRDAVEECFHRLPDGSLMALIGSPVGKLSWDEIERAVEKREYGEDLNVGWDGRFILLDIQADGNTWALWNDWLGSIPVYYSLSSNLRIASSLEPVVVAAKKFSPQDIFLPGLVFLLIHGNFFSDWTLFKDMHTIRPDSVTTITNEGLRSKKCDSVAATDKRWDHGWNELVDEMHSLVSDSIQQTLTAHPSWILPLSGGLDSRLIAAVGAKAGKELRAYTWGTSTARDSIFSRQIAKSLNLQWQRIDLGDDYLARYLGVWADLFGSSMHFHGMYQIPFLETLRGISPAPIVSGFLGECLAGYDVVFQTNHHKNRERLYESHPSCYIFWNAQEIQNLFQNGIEEALEEIADTIDAEINGLDGPWFQKLRFLTLWGRQNHFTYFQSLIADYYRGVGTPYLNRAYANFCLSLPRALLDDRQLQIDMMTRYYPEVMRIGGTYATEPAILIGKYLVKRRIANKLPHKLAKQLLPAYFATKNNQTDAQSMSFSGDKAIYPIPETKSQLSIWFNLDQIDRAYVAALNGDMKSVRKIQAIQAFAYRL